MKNEIKTYFCSILNIQRKKNLKKPDGESTHHGCLASSKIQKKKKFWCKLYDQLVQYLNPLLVLYIDGSRAVVV